MELNRRQYTGSSRPAFRLPLPTQFISGLAKATNVMWTQFVEDNKLEGTAHVLDEGPQQAEGIKLSAGKCWECVGGTAAWCLCCLWCLWCSWEGDSGGLLNNLMSHQGLGAISQRAQGYHRPADWVEFHWERDRAPQSADGSKRDNGSRGSI